jgi:hypothetical protein
MLYQLLTILLDPPTLFCISTVAAGFVVAAILN